jgi:transcriptional regulator GlxA family with amidase domain
MSILDISLACGFVSAPYFSRAYRNTFGCTPRDARRTFQSSGRRTGWTQH